ncbi:MAG: glutaminyl-peptide cyclotransferase [Ignavibacteria bacterium]|nr:glutaminyl-peptide cyclotransferase [Ignavibacteria bacterium]
MHAKLILLYVFITVLLIAACGFRDQRVDQVVEKPKSKSAHLSSPEALIQTIKIVKRLPHDTNAFTQGLLVAGAFFYESTGLNGKSSVRKVDMLTGKILDRKGLDPQFFGEGLAMVDDQLFQITWLNQQGFVYDRKSLNLVREFTYIGEGWGLASDGTQLYKSNGTHVITVHSPVDFSQLRAFSVTLNGRPCDKLNELEWVEGELWANVWQTDRIVRINPKTGVVNAVINCEVIRKENKLTMTSDVLNGIAYDKLSKQVYVTGKNWPWIFLVSVI